MKVRCVQLFDSAGRPVERSSWAQIGHIYHVLSIWSDRGRTCLRLIGEEPTPALFELEMFEIVSSVIPSTWVISSPQAGCLSFGPEPWNQQGFWEEYFDRTPHAVSIFEEEMRKILAADP